MNITTTLSTCRNVSVSRDERFNGSRKKDLKSDPKVLKKVAIVVIAAITTTHTFHSRKYIRLSPEIALIAGYRGGHPFEPLLHVFLNLFLFGTFPFLVRF